MKRRVLIVAVFLVAGAVVNVAVAWGCVCWLPIAGYPPLHPSVRAFHKRLGSPVISYDRHDSHRNFYTELAMSDTAPPCWAFTATTWTSCYHSRALAVTTQARYDQQMSYPRNPPRRVKKDAVPFWSRIRERPSVALALSSESSQYDPTAFPPQHENLYEDAYGWPMLALSTGVLRSTRLNQSSYTPINGIEIGDFLLPLRPFWTGFAVNTFFYAGVLWVLIPGPFVLRRLIRQRLGLCPGCGYDLRHGEHEACPECGVTA